MKCPECGSEMLENYRLISLKKVLVCENPNCGHEEKVKP